MDGKAGTDAHAPVASYRVMKERLRALTGWERWLERPMQWLGLLWLGLILADLIGPPNRILQGLATAVWVLFVVDFALRLALSPHKGRFLRANIVTAISLVIPALRIFRITAAASAFRVARGLRLARMVTSVNRTMLALQQITRHGGFRYVILLTVAIVLTGSAGIYAFEKDADSGIRDFGTALWWTSMMMTTMGSDSWPRTPEGRLLTVLLALYAFAVFGYVTATIATFLIGRDADQTRAGRASQTEMRLVLQELIELRAAVAEVRQLSRSPKNVLADRGLRATGRPQTGGTGEP